MLPLILSFLIAFSNFYSGECQLKYLVPALYVFGDSLVDAGNNNNIPALIPLAKSNYYPYGVDYKNGVATGRVTNGKNVPDFVADYLNLPPPPPYRNESRRPSPTGYNYASAGCGIRPETGLALGCTSMFAQLNMFKTTVNTELPLYLKDKEKRAQHLADSIFLIWVGNNDYLVNYFISPKTSPQQWAKNLIDTFSGQIKTLYGLGARKMVIFEVAPFGCIPAYVKGRDTCDAGKNANSTIYNTQLGSMIRTLASEPEFEDATFTIAKINEVAQNAIANPAEYGLKIVSNSCCEVPEGLVACKKNGAVCKNRDDYFFFDAAHPTQACHRILGERCIYDPSICSPTIEELARQKTNSAYLHSAASSSSITSQ